MIYKILFLSQRLHNIFDGLKMWSNLWRTCNGIGVDLEIISVKRYNSTKKEPLIALYDRVTVVKSDTEYVHHALNGMTVWEAFSIQRSKRPQMFRYSYISYLLMVSRCLSLRIVPQNECVTPCSFQSASICRTGLLLLLLLHNLPSANPSDRAV